MSSDGFVVVPKNGGDWPADPSQYKKLEEIGKGGSATVYLAKCATNKLQCAMKEVDLDSAGVSLDVIRREIQALGLTDSPYVVSYHVSFVNEQNLCMVMDFMDAGSILDIMKFKYPTGLEEVLIASVLRAAANALAYFHGSNRVHRDVKAGNILANSRGEIKMADLGVAAWMVEGGNHRQATLTFVGTPCWMAPEVMEQTQGHGYPADIWSFGITALELARGQAPFAKFPPLKVMVMVVGNPPPALEPDEVKKFSTSFKQVIEACLQKEPKDRVTATTLLTHKFFQKTKPADYIATTLVKDLPSLGERYQLVKRREIEAKARNLGKKSDAGEKGAGTDAAATAGSAADKGEGSAATAAATAATASDADGAKAVDGVGSDGVVGSDGDAADGDDKPQQSGSSPGTAGGEPKHRHSSSWDFGEDAADGDSAGAAAAAATDAGGDAGTGTAVAGKKKGGGKKVRTLKGKRKGSTTADATGVDEGSGGDDDSGDEDGGDGGDKKKSLDTEQKETLRKQSVAAALAAAADCEAELTSGSKAVRVRSKSTADGQPALQSNKSSRFKITDAGSAAAAADDAAAAAAPSPASTPTPAAAAGGDEAAADGTGKRKTSVKSSAKQKSKTISASQFHAAKAQHEKETKGRFIVSKGNDGGGDSTSSAGSSSAAAAASKCENCRRLADELKEMKAENERLREKLRVTAQAASAAAAAAAANFD